MTLSFRAKIYTVGIICFLVGGVLVYLFKQIETPKYFSQSTRSMASEYKYIDPLILCNNDTEGTYGEIMDLKKTMEDLVTTEQDKNIITSGSIYFRNLSDGHWVGVNENAQYSPASLLKVPILMAYLKAAENDDSLLSKMAYYVQDPGQEPPLVQKPVLISGQTYPVEDLLRGMIVDSDNTATKMLMGGMNEKSLSQAYLELGLKAPYSTSGTYTMSTRTYALFFRILYNATFLSREMSEKALSILSEVKFNKGLVAGTTAKIPIAHKYGYAILKDTPPRIIELSDCGIIYYPNKSYLLCVMAKGTDPDVTATFIKDVALAADHYIVNE